ncbi:MAG TPA: immunoglobulin domain-containing protein, partial [Verrucomicrobiae bacterium]|nr:immunoglobulin domain-containing protein [Verrucomicrobiae bacterium]
MEPPVILTEPANATVIESLEATFTVEAGGTEPLSYQWYFNGTNLVMGATNAVLVLADAQTSNAGPYHVVVANAFGSVASATATLNVLVPPRITNQSSDRTVIQGNSALVGVIATGTAPLSYQWRRNGLELSGRTNATLIITNVQFADAGLYSVIVTNQAGFALSAPVSVTVLERTVIQSQPASLVVTQG